MIYFFLTGSVNAAENQSSKISGMKRTKSLTDFRTSVYDSICHKQSSEFVYRVTNSTNIERIVKIIYLSYQQKHPNVKYFIHLLNYSVGIL